MCQAIPFLAVAPWLVQIKLANYEPETLWEHWEKERPLTPGGSLGGPKASSRIGESEKEKHTESHISATTPTI